MAANPLLPRNPPRHRLPRPPRPHRPKPVIQPVSQRLDRMIVRVDRLFRERVMLPRLVRPVTPKLPDQRLAPRIHRHPRRTAPRIPQRRPHPLDPVLQQHPVPPQPPPPSSRRPRRPRPEPVEGACPELAEACPELVEAACPELAEACRSGLS